jgi:hypothetical protein
MRLIKKKQQPELIVQDELIVEKVESNENWDFSFDIYEQESKRIEDSQNPETNKKPRITGLRNKFSPFMLELEGLERIKDSISEYGIKVASQSQDIRELWLLYGCLDEYWARIHDVFGTIIINEVKQLKQEALNNLRIAERKGGSIEYKVHRSLLNLRDRIYSIAQRAGFGHAVGKETTGYYDKAQKGITE